METVFAVETARLLGAGRVQPNPAWAMARHLHPHWEFIYFLQGCGRVDLPHAVLRPQQYHLVIYPPGLPHAEISDPTDPEQTVFFSAEVAGTPPAGAHLLLPDPRGDLRWLCEHLEAEYAVHGATPLAATYLRAFLLLVERAWDRRLPVHHDAVDLAVQYLHVRYAEPITLGRLADAVRVTPTHLAHRFTGRMGTSPMRYLQGLRLEAARRLLATTDLPVQEIARQVGYDDPLYFSRVFRADAGCPPTVYRARCSMPAATASIPPRAVEA
ncbi:MAG TPA: AraC family transcriptional regulator [Armatimonadota bacterium]|nr:AraC family transcriptional regulator [Armatimonadota bacterium]